MTERASSPERERQREHLLLRNDAYQTYLSLPSWSSLLPPFLCDRHVLFFVGYLGGEADAGAGAEAGAGENT